MYEDSFGETDTSALFVVLSLQLTLDDIANVAIVLFTDALLFKANAASYMYTPGVFNCMHALFGTVQETELYRSTAFVYEHVMLFPICDHDEGKYISDTDDTGVSNDSCEIDEL